MEEEETKEELLSKAEINLQLVSALCRIVGDFPLPISSRLQAIRASEVVGDAKQAVLYTWLAYLYMKTEDWDKATESAITAYQLDPLQPSTLFRLATCYEQQRQYVKAYDCFCRAVTLSPVTERTPHLAKHARLKQQRDDEKANVFRGDPLAILPLEVVISIMRLALTVDRHAVLRCSWVSRAWRQALNEKYPELWRTMLFTAPELKNQHDYADKRDAWIKRSGGRFHTIIMDMIKVTPAGNIAKAYFPLFAPVKRLKIPVGDDKVVRRILGKFEASCENLEHIIISGCQGDSPSPYLPFQYLHCGFAKTSATDKIQSIRLRNIDFRQPARYHRAIAPSSYPALKYLVSDECAYDELPRQELSIEDRESLPVIVRSDPLHRALRTAVNLRYLKVVYDAPWRWEGNSRSRDLPLVPGKKVRLPHLKTAIIPPPTCKMLDIVAPNLIALSYEADHELRTTGQPMIPTLAESHVEFATLSKLKYVGFECCEDDPLSRLEEWLPYLQSVTRLAIRGGKKSFGKNFAPPQDDRSVQIRLIEALAAHPEWLPKLSYLQLANCYVPEVVLRDYLK